MQSRIIKSDNIELYTESFGNKTNPAILLIAGAMAPAREWPDEFCTQLADAHYYEKKGASPNGFDPFC